jgi:hypothetical protein
MGQLSSEDETLAHTTIHPRHWASEKTRPSCIDSLCQNLAVEGGCPSPCPQSSVELVLDRHIALIVEMCWLSLKWRNNFLR